MLLSLLSLLLLYVFLLPVSLPLLPRYIHCMFFSLIRLLNMLPLSLLHTHRICGLLQGFLLLKAPYHTRCTLLLFRLLLYMLLSLLPLLPLYDFLSQGFLLLQPRYIRCMFFSLSRPLNMWPLSLLHIRRTYGLLT